MAEGKVGRAVITQERLKELLHYDPETGVFARRVTTSSRAIAGTPCGSRTSAGYLAIMVEGARHKAHRLAWLYMTGEWPANEVDHINRVKGDNRWGNLRTVCRAENMCNVSKYSTNTSGAKGVSWNKKRRKWVAQLMLGGKNTYLGGYETMGQAAAAYDLAAYLYNGEFAERAWQPQ
jgi:hypothetical protein